MPSQAFSDLQIVMNIRGTRAAVADVLNLTFNSDVTAAHYDTATNDFSGAAIAGSTALGTTAFCTPAFFIPANTATANNFGPCEMWLYGYSSTTINKSWQSLSWADDTANSAIRLDFQAGQWLQTAAVTSIQIFGQVTANLATGSSVRIYGRI